jgi:hypothetical protein
MLRKQLQVLWVAIWMGMACSSGLADSLDGPDMYVYVEVSVREITVEGMRQRLALLQSSDYTKQADEAIDTNTQVLVADIYKQFGTTASSHVAYGTRHAEQVKSWLEENPSWQSRYAALDSQFRSLSNQLSALRPAQ